jgi:hypothetical protein
MSLILDGTAGLTFNNATGQASSSKVLQVVNATYSTDTSTTSTSYVTTGITASITPLFSTSKILVISNLPLYINAANLSGYFTLYRGASNLYTTDGAFRVESAGATLITSGSLSFADSPATTSSTTYTLYMKSQTAGVTTRVCLNNATATITLMEIAV